MYDIYMIYIYIYMICIYIHMVYIYKYELYIYIHIVKLTKVAVQPPPAQPC